MKRNSPFKKTRSRKSHLLHILISIRGCFLFLFSCAPRKRSFRQIPLLSFPGPPLAGKTIRTWTGLFWSFSCCRHLPFWIPKIAFPLRMQIRQKKREEVFYILSPSDTPLHGLVPHPSFKGNITCDGHYGEHKKNSVHA